jgi:hypothetical protein
MFAKGHEAKLTRNEMVGLINLTGKLSNSLKWYQEWLEREEEMNFHRKVVYFVSILSLVLFNLIIAKLFKKTDKDQVKPNKKTNDYSKMNGKAKKTD